MLKQIVISAVLMLISIGTNAQYSTSGSGSAMAGCTGYYIIN